METSVAKRVAFDLPSTPESEGRAVQIYDHGEGDVVTIYDSVFARVEDGQITESRGGRASGPTLWP